MVCSMQRGWQLYLVTCLEVRIICFGEGLPPLSPGVVYAGIDTDKHRYPIGSGRVTFGNPQSYMKAVAAAFVEIKCQKFCKRVQVRLNDFFSFIDTSILSQQMAFSSPQKTCRVLEELFTRWILIWRMRSVHRVSSDKGPTFAGFIETRTFSLIFDLLKKTCT